MKEIQELIKEIEEIKNIIKKMGDNDIQNYVNYQECKSKAKGMLIILKKWLKQVENILSWLDNELAFMNDIVGCDACIYSKNARDEKVQELTTLKEDLIKDIKELEEVQ